MKVIITSIKGKPVTLCRFDILISVPYNQITDDYLDSYSPTTESVNHLLQKVQFAIAGNAKRKFTIASSNYLIDYVNGQTQKTSDAFNSWVLHQIKENRVKDMNESNVIVSSSLEDFDYIPKKELSNNIKQPSLWYVLPIAIAGESTEVTQAAQNLNSLLSDRSKYKDFCKFIFDSTCLNDIVNICTGAALTLVPPSVNMSEMILMKKRKDRKESSIKKGSM